jgi:hypothetical protein
MPWVGFEPAIPASERAKTVYALDLAATVIGSLGCIFNILNFFVGTHAYTSIGMFLVGAVEILLFA